MKKGDIVQMDNTELIIAFSHITTQLCKEANSRRGESIKSSKEHNWILDELIERFDLDKTRLKKREIY